MLEANPGYWRNAPHVKRLIMKSVPEGTTRVAMLKNGEADIAYALDGEDAENIKRDPRLQLVPSKHASIFWIEFAEQWDPKSPWHDKRLRLAVNYALDRKAINEAACLGFCPPTGVIVPRVMDFALQVEPLAYDPQKAKQLLAEAGYPNGLDAGDFMPIPPFFTRGRGRGELPERGRHPREDAAHGARGLLRRLAGEEAARPVPHRGRATPATRPAASRRSSTPRAATPTAAIPTSTTCSSSRRASATSPSARRCCTGSSSSPSSG